MPDLPTSYTRLTWLEREENISFSLPLTATNTLLLSKRKHARTLQYGGDFAFPSVLVSLGHILSGTMWKNEAMSVFWMAETFRV